MYQCRSGRRSWKRLWVSQFIMTHFICRKAPSSLRAGSQQLSYTNKRHAAGTSSQFELVMFVMSTAVTEAGCVSAQRCFICFTIWTEHVGALMSDTAPVVVGTAGTVAAGSGEGVGAVGVGCAAAGWDEPGAAGYNRLLSPRSPHQVSPPLRCCHLEQSWNTLSAQTVFGRGVREMFSPHL